MMKYIFSKYLNFFCNFILISTFIGGGFSYASPMNSYMISQTTQFEWPNDVSVTPTSLLSYNTVILELSSKENLELKSKLTVIRTKPMQWANLKDIKKTWSDNLKSISKTSDFKTINDKGCLKIDAGRYRCLRLAKASTGEFTADEIIWNRNKDLIEINFGHSKSVKNINQLIQITKISFEDLKRK